MSYGLVGIWRLDKKYKIPPVLAGDIEITRLEGYSNIKLIAYNVILCAVLGYL